MIPAGAHAFGDEHFIGAAGQADWLRVAHILGDGLQQGFGRPDGIVVEVHGGGDPHAQAGAVLSQFQHAHAAIGQYMLVMLDGFVDDILHEDVFFQNGDRCIGFFVFVNGNTVIDACVVFEDEAGPMDESGG